jgi:uncharacterized protein YjbI with pentapeptide repeats
LSEADLRGANLHKADVTKTQLDRAMSLRHTIMPDGRKHE